MSKQATLGFTMIELLVVIAIIGILTSFLLATLSDSRDKAKDNRIRADIRQLRLLAEDSYNSQGGTYINWSQESGIVNEVAVLTDDVDDMTEVADSAVLRESQAKDFCISAPLEAADGHFCSDVTGAFRVSSAPCPDYPVDGAPLRCPV